MVAKSPEQIFIQRYFLFGTIRDLLPFEMLMKIFARARNMEGKKPERKRLSSSNACQRYFVQYVSTRWGVSRDRYFTVCVHFFLGYKAKAYVRYGRKTCWNVSEREYFHLHWIQFPGKGRSYSTL